jgi:hypothetical protein
VYDNRTGGNLDEEVPRFDTSTPDLGGWRWRRRVSSRRVRDLSLQLATHPRFVIHLFAFDWRPPWKSLPSAVIGGPLLESQREAEHYTRPNLYDWWPLNIFLNGISVENCAQDHRWPFKNKMIILLEALSERTTSTRVLSQVKVIPKGQNDHLSLLLGCVP